ncbi:hypothetical protein LTR85_001680 [Meristemomyces frigidus]|nr:hypothetical protein LTR85_001680 [Meristemomyces frigidus]
MALPKHTIDYMTCTTEELQACIISRTGKPAVKHKGKRMHYVGLLRRLDKDSTFRFLDLPPELRSNVYSELLTWPEMGIDLGIRDLPDDGLWDMRWTLVIGNEQVLNEGIDSPTLARIRYRCPEHLHKAHQIIVRVTRAKRSGRTTFFNNHDIFVNHVLYALACPLAKSNSLKRFTLQVIGGDDQLEEANISELLWPLSKLGLPASSIQLSGLAAAESGEWRAQWKVSPVTGEASSYDIWKDEALATTRAQGFRKLLEGLRHGRDETSPLDPTMQRLDAYEDDLEALMDDACLVRLVKTKSGKKSVRLFGGCKGTDWRLSTARPPLRVTA